MKEYNAIAQDINENFEQERGKATSIQTILAIANTMVGSVILVLPINVYDGGLITSIIALIVIGIINYITSGNF